MKRVYHWWLRALIAVGLVALLQGPYAGWHWHQRVVSGRGVFALSPTGTVVYRESAMTLVAGYLVPRIRTWSPWRPLAEVFSNWKLVYALSTALPAALVGVLAYSFLTHRFGPRTSPDTYTRCRKCHYILAGLSEPRCPECGEAI